MIIQLFVTDKDNHLMRQKILAVTAGLCTLLPASPATAETRWGDPVHAVQRLLTAGSGVKITETGTIGMNYRDPGTYPAGTFRYNGGYIIRHQGIATLSRSGMVASKMSRTLAFDSNWRSLREQAAQGDPWAFDMNAQQRPHQAISVNGYTYASGPLYKPKLPAGKAWGRLGKFPGTDAAFGDQLINVFEPATLKALLARGKRYNGLTLISDANGKQYRVPFYQGKLSFGELYALSPTFRKILGGHLVPQYRDLSIGYSLTFTKEGLPISVTAGWERLAKTFPTRSYAISSLYAFGRPARISAPPAAQTARSTQPPRGDDMIDPYTQPFNGQ